MSRSVGEVRFADGSCLFLIYDGTIELARRPLFDSVEAAWAWYSNGSPALPEPDNGKFQEEPVTVFSDRAMDRAFQSSFQSGACRQSMWLTGSQDLEGSMREREDPDDHGFWFSLSPTHSHGDSHESQN
jgi:hypothetical protein